MTQARKGVIAICALSVAILVVLGQLLARQPFAYGADDASSKIAQADDAVTQAFVAVAEAQEAGANVSALLARLNEANAFLAEAHTAFRSGDNGTAGQKADQASDAVQGIVGDAEGLKRSAESDSQGRLVWTASLSSVGLSVLFVVGLFGWRLFKRRYVRQALGMRPEKVNQA